LRLPILHTQSFAHPRSPHPQPDRQENGLHCNMGILRLCNAFAFCNAFGKACNAISYHGFLPLSHSRLIMQIPHPINAPSMKKTAINWPRPWSLKPWGNGAMMPAQIPNTEPQQTMYRIIVFAWPVISPDLSLPRLHEQVHY
jgi:hypothetical protein